MFGETTISYVKIGNHPIETTIKYWLFKFQVYNIFQPGESWTRKCQLVRDISENSNIHNTPLQKYPKTVPTPPFYWKDFLSHLGVSKNNGKTPQIIHGLIGFSIIFTIHFGGFTPIFGLTPIWYFGVVLFEGVENFGFTPTDPGCGFLVTTVLGAKFGRLGLHGCI